MAEHAFECGICASTFNNKGRQPLLLECGHTFCKDCLVHRLGPQRCCPYCRQELRRDVGALARNYALENAMEAANLPLVDLLDRWGIANAERMMVRPDHLQLVAPISRKGNSGVVWKGTLWGKEVAVKLVRIEDVDERSLDCLRREVAVLLHTVGECKQVCIYKGFCLKNGSFAIIMRLYSCSLAAALTRAPAQCLPLPLALKYGMDVAKGLVELHRLGVICADLKPDNVLIDEDIGDAVIADFGISSVVNATLGMRRSSNTQLRGTPHYMAPEQFGPQQHHTIKADIWGFACTLLHVLQGHAPWQGHSIMQICTQVGIQKLSPPLPEGLPSDVGRLLTACLQPEACKRPSAQQVLQALSTIAPKCEPSASRLKGTAAQRVHMLRAARSMLSGLQSDVQQLARRLDDDQVLRTSSDPSDSGASSSGTSPRSALQACWQEYKCQQQQQQAPTLQKEPSSGLPSAPPLHMSSGWAAASGLEAATSGERSAAGAGAPQLPDSPSNGPSGFDQAADRLASRWDRWPGMPGSGEASPSGRGSSGSGGAGGGGAWGKHQRSVSMAAACGGGMERGTHSGRGSPGPAAGPGHMRSASEHWAVGCGRLDQGRPPRLDLPVPPHLAGCARLSEEGDGAAAGAKAGGDCNASGQPWGPWGGFSSPGRPAQPASPHGCSASSSYVQGKDGGCGPPAQVTGSPRMCCSPPPCKPQGQQECGKRPPSPCKPATAVAATAVAAGVCGVAACAASQGSIGGAAVSGDSSGYLRRLSSTGGSPRMAAMPVQQAAAASPLGGGSSGSSGSSGSKQAKKRQSSPLDGLRSLLFGRPKESPGQLGNAQRPGAAAAAGAIAATAGMGAAAAAAAGASPPRKLPAVRSLFGVGTKGLAGAAVAAGAAAAVAGSAGAGSKSILAVGGAAAAAGAAATGAVAVGAMAAGAAAAGAAAAASAVPSSPKRMPGAGSPACSAGGSTGGSASGGHTRSVSLPAHIFGGGSGGSASSTGGSMDAPVPAVAAAAVAQMSPLRAHVRQLSHGHMSVLSTPASPKVCGPSSMSRSCASPSGLGMAAAPLQCGGSPSPPRVSSTGGIGGSGGACSSGQQPQSRAGSAAEKHCGAGPHAAGSVCGGSCAASRGASPAKGPPALPGAKGGAAVTAGNSQQQGRPASAPQAPNAPEQQQQQRQQEAQEEAQRLEAQGHGLATRGEHDAAEQLQRRAVALLEAALGPRAPPTTSALARLASCCGRMGRSAEAEALFRRVVALRQDSLGPRHPHVATAMSNLATCLYGQGKTGEAAGLYRAAMEMRQEALGERHPDVASCQNNLALCLARCGNYTEAESLYRCALDARAAALGPDHPDVALTAHNLGICLSSVGRHADALQLHRQALAVRQRLHGRGSSGGGGNGSGGKPRMHPELLASHRNVGLCLSRQGTDAEAALHLDLVMRHSRPTPATPAAEQMAFAAVAEEVAQALTRLGQHARAEEALWEALEARRSILGDGHELVAGLEEQLRGSLAAQCKHK